ncbi:helix-turn-helix domain-containing protein [Thermus caliditerrae]|uniref:helix-turn-helix domain-containing protein n=1 Tax=Thermus caliditerrae TaxID=1330700 RepID=UPI003991768B
MGKRAGAEGTATPLALDPRDRPLYTLREAARYLGVPEATLRAWVRGRSYPVRGGQGWGWSGPLIATPEGGPLLSFHNLVEANVLVALRKNAVSPWVRCGRWWPTPGGGWGWPLPSSWTSRWAWGRFF